MQHIFVVVSKLDVGQIQLHPKELDIEPFLQDLIETSLPLAEQKGNQLRLDISSSGVMFVDEGRLRQILQALLSNSCKFTEKGEITLSVRRDHRVSGEYWLFEVRDTGIGIEPE
jgi:signal transduction histidine kinase